MQNLWRVPAFARCFRLGYQRDDIGRNRDLRLRQVQPGKCCARLFGIFQMGGVVRMIMLQPVEDFRTFHRSFGGNEGDGAFIERLAVEGSAIGHLTEGLGGFIILLLRQPGLADAQPQKNRVLTAAEKPEECDFRFPEVAAVKCQVGQSELRADMIGRCRQHLGKGDIGGRLLAHLVKLEALLIDEAYAARVERATEVIAGAGAEKRAA